MFDFPLNPASGTVVMMPDGSYRVWDSTKWRASPSSSTITTGPFLPIAGGVMTGALSLFGNATSALHAVPLQQLSAATAGAPFLPLATGGTVSGSVSIGANQPNYITMSGGAAGAEAKITTAGPWGDLDIEPNLNGRLRFAAWRQYPAASARQELCRFDYTVLGTRGGVTDPYTAELHSVNSDTLQGGMSYFNFFGGPQAGATGGRNTMGINLIQGGATTIGTDAFYVALTAWAKGSYNAGGTSSVHAGSLFASNDLATLESGATYWEELCGYELDIGAAAGTSISFKHGIKVNLWSTDAVSGSAGHDTAYCLSANATTGATSGWDVGFAFGDGYGYWPMKTTSALIGTVPPYAGGPAYAAAWGVDFSAVAFTGGLIRGPGFSVNGSGGFTATGGNLGGGLHFGSADAPSTTDLSRHLDLRDGQFGINVFSGALNILSGSGTAVYTGGVRVGVFTASGLDGTVVGAVAPAAGSFTNLASSGGIHFSGVPATGTDLSKHIDLRGGNTGFCADAGGTLNYVVATGDIHNIWVGSSVIGQFNSTGIAVPAITQLGGSTLNYNVAAGQVHNFFCGGTFSGQVATAGITTGALTIGSGATIRNGGGAATGTQPKGSLWLRSDGAVGSTLYVSQGGGTWNAVAGV